MTTPFGSSYSNAYDDIYRAKDYRAECDVVERALKAHRAEPVRSVLDLGCGTGGHALVLAARGYDVVGVELSEGMLTRARAKAEDGELDGSARFFQGDIRTIELNERFDAALMMFAVLCYQSANDDVTAALQTARRHLGAGGLLLGDVWYGPAVLSQRPCDRVREFDTEHGHIVRFASGRLDTATHQCTVTYRLWRIDGQRAVATDEERHSMRYFFPLELELFLDVAGFRLVRLGAFPNVDEDPSEDTWNVLFVAKAI